LSRLDDNNTAYTNDQMLLDLPHKDLRRARCGQHDSDDYRRCRAVAGYSRFKRKTRWRFHSCPGERRILVDLAAEVKKK
jgi:hypothetical protein